jgi:hypothetical protein
MSRLLENNTLLIVLLIVLVVGSILLLNRSFQSTMDHVEWREEIHKVTEGDSLWAISYDYCPDSVDRREWVKEIRALNDLRDSSIIHPDQRLIVLAPVK